jgi:hypothetical protein
VKQAKTDSLQDKVETVGKEAGTDQSMELQLLPTLPFLRAPRRIHQTPTKLHLKTEIDESENLGGFPASNLGWKIGEMPEYGQSRERYLV